MLCLEIFRDISVIKNIRIHHTHLRGKTEYISVIEQGQIVHNYIPWFSLVIFIIDRGFFCNNLHFDQTVQHINKSRTTGYMRLWKQVAVTGISSGQRLKDLICIIDFGNLRFQIHGNFIFKSRIRWSDQLYNIFSDRKLWINQLIEIRNPAKYAVQTHLILVWKTRIELCRIIIIHRLQIDSKINSSVQRIFIQQKRLHHIYKRSTENQLQRWLLSVLINQGLKDTVHSNDGFTKIRIFVQHKYHFFFDTFLKHKIQKLFHASKWQPWETIFFWDQGGKAFYVIHFRGLLALIKNAVYICLTNDLLD